jgi:hypothetical protein
MPFAGSVIWTDEAQLVVQLTPLRHEVEDRIKASFRIPSFLYYSTSS